LHFLSYIFFGFDETVWGFEGGSFTGFYLLLGGFWQFRFLCLGNIGSFIGVRLDGVVLKCNKSKDVFLMCFGCFL